MWWNFSFSTMAENMFFLKASRKQEEEKAGWSQGHWGAMFRAAALLVQRWQKMSVYEYLEKEKQSVGWQQMPTVRMPNCTLSAECPQPTERHQTDIDAGIDTGALHAKKTLTPFAGASQPPQARRPRPQLAHQVPGCPSDAFRIPNSNQFYSFSLKCLPSVLHFHGEGSFW